MNQIKTTKLNMVVSLAYEIVAIALGLIVPRITLTSYGSSVNGLLSSALQFISYLTLFEAGIQVVAKKALYRTVGNNDKAGTNEILAAVNKNYKKTGVFYFLGLVLLSLGYSLLINEEGLEPTTVFFVVFFSGLSNVVLFFFQGKYRILLEVEGKHYFIGIINIITNISNNVVKIILLWLNVDIAVVVFGSFAVSLIPAGIIMAHIKKKYGWIDLKAKPNYSELSQSKIALIHEIAGMVFSHTDTLILTVFCGLKVVSVYVIYRMVNTYIFTFSKIPLQSISFRLGQLYNTDKEKYKTYVNSVELLSCNVGFILFTVTLCLTTAFVGMYTSGVQDINYVDPVLAILFVSAQLLNLMRLPMLNTIHYAGHFRQTLMPTIIESVINIVVSVIGVVFLGIYGVLLVTVAALLYRTAEIIIYTNRKILGRSPLRTFSYYITGTVLLTVIYVLYRSLGLHIDSWLIFIAVGGILTVIVGAAFVAVSYLLFKEEVNVLRSDIFKRK